MKIDDSLKQFCTPRSLEILNAVNETGSIRAASKKLGLARSSIQDTLRIIAKKAGCNLEEIKSPTTNSPAPPNGFSATGHTIHYDKNGDVKNHWVKASIDAKQQSDSIKAMIQAMVDEMPPVKIPAAPLDWQDDIIPWLQIGDAHIGMLAHATEIGENFDLKIAEAEICAAIGILIDELPACERLVVNDLGDFTHYENFKGVTEASGNPLDYDSRFPKMIYVYVRVMRFIIEKCLTKARIVDLIVNQGNHSRTNDIWMGEFIKAVYGDSGRVNVLNNGGVFIAYRMGNTLVMTHHSDTCKPNRLAQVMTTDFKRDYGETQFHYIDVGHVHHGMVMKEHPGIVIESFNHLAALDKWAHDSGYRNRKSITIILRSKKYGEVGRRLLPIEEVRARMVGSEVYLPQEKDVYRVPVLENPRTVERRK